MEGHLAGKTGISVFFSVWFIAKATAQFSQDATNLSELRCGCYDPFQSRSLKCSQLIFIHGDLFVRRADVPETSSKKERLTNLLEVDLNFQWFSLLNKKIKKKEQQCGFHPGRGTVDQL